LKNRDLNKTLMQITSETIIYNGKNIRQILSKMDLKLRACKMHRNLYVKNCIEVHKSETSGFNLNYAQLIRNSNFNLTRLYLENKL
jgi:hypothetical protein